MSTTTAGPAARPWRLGGRARKLVLVLHLASVGARLGLDVTMGVLVFGSLLTDDPERKAISFQALELVAVWPMTASGLTCLVTGVILALGGKYGLLKYWWVAVKLFLNLLLSTLTLVALRPGVEAMADQARAGGDLNAADLIFPPIVSPTLLVFAVVLSVFKPWGRLRKKG
ncbi:hypothetical protein GCM10029976_047550 [Kribbella albertanoniae]|uniref:DUF2269 domain-containing protein n=1 Tax=Kribbella albertanoniae TaxID=1266829 RepID=A0A4R4Q4C1_9ACTN|nr:hypothetical protein [Kribbella albertanoniae]TDC29722.1 hypothetical protein E1261_14990 [Kribbella albertanoniae]